MKREGVRPQWVVSVVLVLQFGVPLAALFYRVLTGDVTPYGWMMYSTG
ncbi:MAG: hypothetical protein ACLFWH_05305 [Actinomycetota bacterium]